MSKSRQREGLRLARKVSELFARLTPEDKSKTIVLALNRNAIPIALEVAYINSLPLNVFVCREIAAPGQPLLPVGAVASDQSCMFDDSLVRSLRISSSYIDAQKETLSNQARLDEISWCKLAGLDRFSEYMGKRIIIVDDGMETGMAALVAARSLSQSGALELILAAPVAPKAALALLNQAYNHVLLLEILPDLSAIKDYYSDFDEVTNEDAVWALRWAMEIKTRNRVLATSKL